MKEIVDQNKTVPEVANPGNKVKCQGKLYVAFLNKKTIRTTAVHECFSNGFGENISGCSSSVFSETEDSPDNNRMPAILTPDDERRLYDEYY
jgi:hypothetical protein